jgi:hypothetical protein
VCDLGFRAENLSCVPSSNGGGSGTGGGAGGGTGGGSGGGSPSGPCATNPCAATGKSCSEANGTAICSCPAGFGDVGSGCVMLDACSSHPCTQPSQNVCYAVDGGATCLCNPGFQLTATGCAPIMLGACSATPHALPGDDSFEPDECPSTSKLYASPMSHTLTTGDVDWAHTTAAPRQLVRFAVTGSTVPLSIDAFDSDAFTAIGADHTGSTNPTLMVAVPNNLAFARVSATVGSDVGPYTLTVSDAGFDDYVNVLAVATVNASSTTFAGQVQYAGDEDVTRFPALAGHSYSFSINSLPTNLQVDIVDLDGATVRKSLDSNLSANTSHIARAKTSGNWALRAKARVTGATGSFSITVNDLGVDDHGDVLLDADPIAFSSTLATGSFERNSDLDVFTFSAVAGRIYRLTCNSNSYGCMTSMRDAAGTVLAQQNQSYSSTNTTAAIATANGVWNLSVSSYNGSSAAAYTYQLEDLGTDDYGANLTMPTLLTVGAAATTGMLELTGDHDAFGFTAVTGKIYKISCTSTPANQCAATVRDPAGVTVGLPGYSPSGTRDVLIKAASGGVHTIDVTANASLSYAVTVSETGPDDFPDTPASATSLVLATPTPGVMSFQGDLDYFSFNTSAGTYRLRCTGDSSACEFDVLDPNGAAVVSNSTSAGFKSTGGIWRFAVTGTGNRGTGNYSLTLSDTGPDDHSDTSVGATALTFGAPVNGNIQFGSDADVFTFTATAPHLYRVDCSPGTGVFYVCGLTVKDAGGATVASLGATSGGLLSFKAPSSGAYSVEVRSLGDNYLGAYTLQVSDDGVDDYPDSPIVAAPITLGAGRTGKIDFGGDRDVVSFTTVANHIHRLTCTTSVSQLCQVTLRNALNQTAATGTPSAGVTTLIFYVPSAETWTADLGGGSTSTGSYTFQVVDVGADDYPNTGAGAQVVTSGTLNGDLQFSTDVDVLAFTAIAGRYYNFNVVTGPTGFTTTVRDQSGTVVKSGTGSVGFVAGSGGNDTVSFSTTSATGAWSVVMSDGVDDASNTSSGAPTLTLSTVRNGRFDYVSDEDFYAVTLAQGTSYSIITGGGIGNIYLYVYLADGVTLATGGNLSVNTKSFAPTTSGTFYVRVLPAISSTIGDYTLRVQ